MDQNFQANFKKYADIAIKIGLNLQPGQKLILQDMRRNGIPIQTAPVVRELVTFAYQAGAKLVDVLWGDADLKLIQYEYAPKESFDDFPVWQAQGVMDVIEDGGAVLSVAAFILRCWRGRIPI